MKSKTPWNIVTDDPKLKTSDIIKQMREKFGVWVYREEYLDDDFPPPTKKTTRTFQPNIEADPENANKSADDLEGQPGITLRERLIMELNYFNDTGKHLDEDNVTLCTGSRRLGGDVPGVDWDRDYREVYVDVYNPGNASPYLRARLAVPSSLNTSTLKSRVAKLEEIIKHHKLGL